MNLYYEVDYSYPCKNIRRSDRRKLRKKSRRLDFLRFMFAQDERSYINEFKQMELTASNHLDGIKYVFNIGQKIYALRLINTTGVLHRGRFFDMKDKPVVR